MKSIISFTVSTTELEPGTDGGVVKHSPYKQTSGAGLPVQVSRDGQVSANQRPHQPLFEDLLLLQEVQQVIAEGLQPLVLLSCQTKEQNVVFLHV